MLFLSRRVRVFAQLVSRSLKSLDTNIRKDGEGERRMKKKKGTQGRAEGGSRGKKRVDDDDDEGRRKRE